MKRILSVCLLLALCLGLCGCDLTLDVHESGSSDYWGKSDTSAAVNNSQSSQTVQQEQYVQQPNTYVPAVTKPVPETAATLPMIPAESEMDESYGELYGLLAHWIDNCDIVYMDESHLNGMNEAECRIARNAIYAKSGRIFNASDLTEFFSGYSWYSPRIHPDNFTNSMLNDVQLHNLNVVIEFEKKFG